MHTDTPLVMQEGSYATASTHSNSEIQHASDSAERKNMTSAPTDDTISTVLHEASYISGCCHSSICESPCLCSWLKGCRRLCTNNTGRQKMLTSTKETSQQLSLMQ